MSLEWMKKIEPAKMCQERIEYPSNDTSHRVQVVSYLTPQKKYGTFKINKSPLRFEDMVVSTTNTNIVINLDKNRSYDTSSQTFILWKS